MEWPAAPTIVLMDALTDVLTDAQAGVLSVVHLPKTSSRTLREVLPVGLPVVLPVGLPVGLPVVLPVGLPVVFREVIREVIRGPTAVRSVRVITAGRRADCTTTPTLGCTLPRTPQCAPPTSGVRSVSPFDPVLATRSAPCRRTRCGGSGSTTPSAGFPSTSPPVQHLSNPAKPSSFPDRTRPPPSSSQISTKKNKLGLS